MKVLNRIGAELYLKRNRILDPRKINEILDGFDFGKAVYEETLYPGTDLYQFVRSSSASNFLPDTGNWFCLSGATLSGLAIIGGVAGRRPKKFSVVAPVVVLEGSASKQSINWNWGGGGAGGATQMYIPTHLVLHGLRPYGEYKTDELNRA